MFRIPTRILGVPEKHPTPFVSSETLTHLSSAHKFLILSATTVPAGRQTEQTKQVGLNTYGSGNYGRGLQTLRWYS